MTTVEIKELNGAIENAEWIEAKTYRHFAPHEYIRSWQEPETFKVIAPHIDKSGVSEEFRNTGKFFVCFYYKNHKYWKILTMDVNPSCTILNRAIVEEGKDNAT